MAFLVATTSLPAVYRPNGYARTTTAGTPHARAKNVSFVPPWRQRGGGQKSPHRKSSNIDVNLVIKLQWWRLVTWSPWIPMVWVIPMWRSSWSLTQGTLTRRKQRLSRNLWILSGTKYWKCKKSYSSIHLHVKLEFKGPISLQKLQLLFRACLLRLQGCSFFWPSTPHHHYHRPLKNELFVPPYLNIFVLPFWIK